MDKTYTEPKELFAAIKDLDAVYMVAAYHDVLNEKRDVAAMNRAVFAALKPGGRKFGAVNQRGNSPRCFTQITNLRPLP